MRLSPLLLKSIHVLVIAVCVTGCAKKARIALPPAPTIAFMPVAVVPPGTAQRHQVAVTKCALQPVATFKAAFGTRLPGTGLYSCTVVSQVSKTLDLKPGELRQAIEQDFGVIPINLVDVTLESAAKKSKQYVAAQVGSWVGYMADVLVASGTIAVGSTAIKVAIPLITQALHKVQDTIIADVPNPKQFLDQFLGTKDVLLSPLGDADFLILGQLKANYKPREIPVLR